TDWLTAAAHRGGGRHRHSGHGELLVRAPWRPHHREARYGVRLVVLEQADVVDRQTGLLQQLPNPGDWSLHHPFRLDAGRVVRDDAGERRDAVPVRGLPGHHDHRGTAVAQLGRVARGDLTAFPEDRRQFRELVARRVHSDAFVDLHA